MLKVSSTGTPLPLAGEKTSDDAADQTFNCDCVFDGILRTVASSGFIGSRRAQRCSGGSLVTFSFISPKLMEKHN